MSRAHNFSAGPAALPEAILPELQQAIVDFQGAGAGIMELSHRGHVFEPVRDSAEARVRRVLGVPEGYTVLFQQGGASLQFYMLALNLLPGAKADYLVTGTWATKALEEGRRSGDAKAAWSGKEGGFRHIPADSEYTVREDALYLHYTSNNTIAGTQFHFRPEAAGKPLVCDMSSDIASRPVDWTNLHMVYAGAQKNLGPSGVTVVVLSPWAMERSAKDLTPMLSYRVQAENQSMFNTPNTWGIYVLERVLAWIEDLGGVSAIAALNQKKADLLYGELDRTAFWRPHADRPSRSLMNITWRLPTEELEKRFVSEAEKVNLQQLKGHRSVGGLRASLYNAVPYDSVVALVDFMRAFERSHG